MTSLLKSDFQNFLLLIILTLTFLEIFVGYSCVHLVSEVVPVNRGVCLLCTVIRVFCTWMCSNCYKAGCFSNFKKFFELYIDISILYLHSKAAMLCKIKRCFCWLITFASMSSIISCYLVCLSCPYASLSRFAYSTFKTML